MSGAMRKSACLRSLSRFRPTIRIKHCLGMESLHSSKVTSSSISSSASSPFDLRATGKDHLSAIKKKRKRFFVPRIAAVRMTEESRTFFKALLKNPPRPEIIGVMLNYDQSQTGEPRMVFSFSFVTADDIDPLQDEGVSLEVIDKVDSQGANVVIPKPPTESRTDGLPKLYVHHNAFLKVLGATVDVDKSTITPILYDREGNRMDPNA